MHVPQYCLPIRIVVCDGVDHILVALKSEQFLPRHGVPYLTRSIITTSDKTERMVRGTDKSIIILLCVISSTYASQFIILSRQQYCKKKVGTIEVLSL